MRSRLYLFIFIVPLVSIAQFKVEWIKEVSLPGEKAPVFSSLVLKQGILYYSLRGGDGSGIFIQPIDNNSFTHSLTVSQFISDMQINDNFLLSFGGCNFTHRTLNGDEVSDICLPLPPSQTLSAVSAKLANGKIYAAHWMNTFASYDISGNLKWRKESSQPSKNFALSVGGPNIYVLTEGNLTQYDTVGDLKWNVAISDVYNINADRDGNCFVLTANDETTITKYGSDGKIVWAKKTPGQWSRGSSIYGDSLLVCGNVSPGAMIDNKQPCAFTIMSAATGAIIQQQVITVVEDNSVMENFTNIATDGKNVYVGGSHSSWGIGTCFLLKLSKERNTTGLKDEKAARTSFNIFPNPSGSKFTITCESNQSSTATVTVRNISGQVVYKKEITCNPDKSFTLDLGKQAAGNYNVEIESGNQKTMKKIIVQ